jgi:hypothetical protein
MRMYLKDDVVHGNKNNNNNNWHEKIKVNKEHITWTVH